MPLFIVASAQEQSKTQPHASAPAWRSTLGNLAAGALAGCAVESGQAMAMKAFDALIGMALSPMLLARKVLCACATFCS